ncbi:MAG: ATP-dependent zinc metalloprotease FtsH [Brevinemataceae bacterium]
MSRKKKDTPNGSDQGLYFGLFLLISLGIFVIWSKFDTSQTIIDYSQFFTKLSEGKIQSVSIQGQKIEGYMAGITGTQKSESFLTIIPLNDPDLLPMLREHKVSTTGKLIQSGSGTSSIWWIVMISVGLLLMWSMFSRGGGSNGPGQAMNFGKTRARLHKDAVDKKTFKDVAGANEAKEDLQEVVEFLKHPKKFVEIGAKIPKGVLLVGPPGTGKTLLAKAVAGEANVPFFSVSGSEFVEMFVGVGASRVRDLFANGRKKAPAIIFIDELDAVGRARGAGWGGSHDEREQTLNQILVEMDGFDSSEGLIIIAATNRPDILDPALKRPGRFDRQVVVDRPDVKAREAILHVHTKKMKLAENVNLDVIAKGTPGFTGADLANLANEAALKAGRENRKEILGSDFEFAKDKVMMGPERRSMVMTDEDKLTTAYHEAGHAVSGHYLTLVDPVHKVTIIPRGQALGITYFLPQSDKYSYIKKKVEENLIMALSGRAAEELMFGTEYISAGARGDIEHVTKYARSMVCEWGMSDLLGPIQYGESDGPVFLAKDISTRKTYSEITHEQIDSEIKRIVTDAYKKAVSLLESKKDKLIELAEILLEQETLSSDQVTEILGHVEHVKNPVLDEFRKRFPARVFAASDSSESKEEKISEEDHSTSAE